MVGVQDDLEKRAAERRRLCHSTGRAAESILPAPLCEAKKSTTTEIRGVLWIPFTVSASATSPSSPQHSQQQRQQRHHMYLSFTLAVGASSPSAEEDIPEIEARWWRRDATRRLHVQIPEVFVVVILYSLRAKRFVASFWPGCTTRSSTSARLAARQSKWHGSYRTSTFPVAAHMRVTSI